MFGAFYKIISIYIYRWTSQGTNVSLRQDTWKINKKFRFLLLPVSVEECFFWRSTYNPVIASKVFVCENAWVWRKLYCYNCVTAVLVDCPTQLTLIFIIALYLYWSVDEDKYQRQIREICYCSTHISGILYHCSLCNYSWSDQWRTLTQYL